MPGYIKLYREKEVGLLDYYIKIKLDKFQDYNLLEDAVKENINNSLFDGILPKLTKLLKVCESPIERLLYSELLNAKMYYGVLGGTVVKDIKIFPQHTIILEQNTYRADFLIEYEKEKLIVECDGHEFHEKTKEQAQKDKKRDRELIQAGYKIIHFTGSEIYTNTYKCFDEIAGILGLKSEG
jgi:very-short-patch-repair endonuclease